ncbi:MAG: hypothetical protein ACM3WT_02380 [Bacillota bacterium]
MFILLLLGSLCISFIVSMMLARTFRKPVSAILGRIIPEDISSAWVAYIVFAMHVAGISNGVRVWDLERYFATGAMPKEAGPIPLTSERIFLECYRTLIGTLQGVSGVLLTFFAVSMIAYVIIRLVESRREKNA